MAKTQSDIGLIGLAVMGQNLALNIADHGFQISVFNRTVEKTDKFVAENPSTPGGIVGTKTLKDFVASLAKPRKMIILVQAGKATDAVIDALVPGLELVTAVIILPQRQTVLAAKQAAEVDVLTGGNLRFGILHTRLRQRQLILIHTRRRKIILMLGFGFHR